MKYKTMKTTGLSGLLCIALAAFALPAAAQTPDGITPANEGICDPLADATPGLQGLCIAMCEAQDCEAELNPFTGEVEFARNCSPSSKQLLANYDKIATVSDPAMPCVKVPCPCWTATELEDIGGKSTDICTLYDNDTGLSGASTDGGGWEWARVSVDLKYGQMCDFSQADPPITRTEYSIGAAAFAVCKKTIEDECKARKP